MKLAFVSTSATAFDLQMNVIPHEYRGKCVRVLGDAAHGRGQKECAAINEEPGVSAYVRDEFLHLFDVREDINGYVVSNIRPDGYLSDGPSHRSLVEACRWFVSTCVGVPE